MNKLKQLCTTFLLLALFTYSCQQDEDLSIEPEDITPISPYLELNGTFPIDRITDVKFEFSTLEWNKLLTNFDINPDNKEYIIGNFTINQDNITTQLDSVGIRLRGNTSRRRPEGESGELHNSISPAWHHAHFSVSLKKYRTSQRFKGQEKINFKWFKDDANYVREIYCYDLFERFGIWTAPHSSYSTLTLKIKEDAKPAYFGVYHMVESIDDDYLKNREELFGSRSGNLWKCSWGANLKDADSWRMGVENITLDPSTSKTYIYDLKTNEQNISSAKTQLSTFITEFNGKSGSAFKTWLVSRMDVNLFLKTYAVNVMVGMWDDYWANNNNYYIYFNQENKFFFIPFDYDNTLGTSLMINDSGTQDLLKWGNSNSNPFVSKILSITEYKTIYVNYLYDLTNPSNDYFYSDWSIPRIENWQSMIEPYVSNDTGEDMFIGDEPASWGNQPQYRLNSMSNNYFVTRQTHLPTKP